MGLRLERGRYYSAPCETRYAVRKEQEYQCGCCQRECDHDNGDKLEVHHKKPECQGGTHDEENLVGLCHSCHEFFDWMAQYKGEYIEDEPLEQMEENMEDYQRWLIAMDRGVFQ